MYISISIAYTKSILREDLYLITRCLIDTKAYGRGVYISTIKLRNKNLLDPQLLHELFGNSCKYSVGKKLEVV